MEMYETEEQQIEAAKKWWKQNGTSLIVGALIGLSIVGGWKFYQSEQNAHRIQASELYNTIANQVVAESTAEKLSEKKLVEIGDLLTSEYADTPYAALASLMLAKFDYEKGDVAAAISKLSWAGNNATDVETRQIAKTRLIRVYLDEGKLVEAEDLISVAHPSGFDALYAEFTGDLYIAKGDKAKAREAYDKAILLSGSDVRRLLQLKRQELGQ